MDIFIIRLTTCSVNSESARHETMINTMSIDFLVYKYDSNGINV